ncbi:LLM class flavin-dependent oxidoreductase [Luteimicrobium subarcticum]|uniref:Alkanesulfonate monooxygenase SsuD/methylene tetrahydromethanopterin reductase-like flavin-dependent oxidoreductase (Luciferase family) n=1 Tax=Luteimicrobium subarcticum TaxID=620910 RepID=A0A2M8WQN0_9MICO|nr:LLM class flavin-dependent oxidoreductase [Luteimicrobium subarcticum]PJI93250.1 alkanesulfonate monooxygenase SsuD/methylene tetrahydromethanopterin reductase-like flavin-dependent oxidoreductase (luciferase family) [Luteimicrobium subarcticum]
MRYGIVASSGTARQVVDLAVEAERAGWDGFFTWDGVSIGPLDTWDPWAVLAAAAVRTERVTLGALVVAVPRRRAWDLARQALTVDHLSGGRLVLPVGVGAVDDRAFAGVPGQVTALRDRAEALDEVLAFLDQAWTGEPFDAEGPHVTAHRMQFLPRPVQRPRVPVWPVAAWPSASSLDRAARFEGVVPQLRGERGFEPLAAQDVAALCTDLAQRRAAVGRTGEFDVVVQGVTDDADPGASRVRLSALADAGATWWVEARWDPVSATPDALLTRVRQGPPGP